MAAKDKWSDTTCKEVWSDVVDKCGIPGSAKLNSMINGIDQQIASLGTLKSAGICNVKGVANVDSSIKFFQGLKNDIKEMTAPGAASISSGSKAYPIHEGEHEEEYEEKEVKEDKARQTVDVTKPLPAPAPKPAPVIVPAVAKPKVVQHEISSRLGHGKKTMECAITGGNPDDICKCNKETEVLVAKGNAFDHLPACLNDLHMIDRINLSGNRLKKITPVRGWRYINLSNNQISSVDMGMFRRAVNLDLSSNVLSGAFKIAHNAALKHLNLANNKITSVDNLAGNSSHSSSGSRQITRLVLDNNKLTGIPGIKSLKHLKRLYVSGNQLGKLSAIGLSPENKEIYIIDASRNQLTSTAGLGINTWLTYLYLHDNAITEMNGLEGLSKLQYLVLDNNKIARVKGLDNVKRLRLLRAPGNQISAVTSIERLPNLARINLANNKIGVILASHYPASLDRLILYGNPIATDKKIRHAGMPEMRVLRQRGTTVSITTSREAKEYMNPQHVLGRSARKRA